ncbi:MAG: hypothetical protein ACRDLP_11260, partial [Solirubrobacteraceae bacterium]
TWINEATIAAARESMPPSLFEREYLGQFAEAGLEEAVVPRAWVQAAQACSLVGGDSRLPHEVGRFGLLTG